MLPLKQINKIPISLGRILAIEWMLVATLKEKKKVISKRLKIIFFSLSERLIPPFQKWDVLIICEAIWLSY